MIHRDRILAAINHEPIDRFPTDMWATTEINTKLLQYFNINSRLELYNILEIDGIFGVSPQYCGPSFVASDPEIWLDEWRMGYRKINYPTGVYDEQVVYPLAEACTIADLENFPWPSPDWYDYSSLLSQIKAFPDRAIECGYTAIFYLHNRLRGLELSLRDPLERPEFTHFLIAKLSDFFTEYHARCFEAAKGGIDLTQVTDDFGSQTGLLISPKLFDTFYREPILRAIDLAHSYRIKVFHHDDGDMRVLIPRLIEMGIAILNPIQWRCGNWDLAGLKSSFGQKLCFHGGVDNQLTMPFKSPNDVKHEVSWLKKTLGSDGTGLIIAPCHNIQANTPVENIIAMYDEAQLI